MAQIGRQKRLYASLDVVQLLRERGVDYSVPGEVAAAVRGFAKLGNIALVIVAALLLELLVGWVVILLLVVQGLLGGVLAEWQVVLLVLRVLLVRPIWEFISSADVVGAAEVADAVYDDGSLDYFEYVCVVGDVEVVAACSVCYMRLCLILMMLLLLMLLMISTNLIRLMSWFIVYVVREADGRDIETGKFVGRVRWV